jgi:hypothetical protein
LSDLKIATELPICINRLNIQINHIANELVNHNIASWIINIDVENIDISKALNLSSYLTTLIL